MIRIRFHGRGGHGIKTAGRITGTAAFLAGLQVQDSPVYGAERRGAPVTAFARIGQQPIRERGTIEAPDLILIADDTLLSDRSAAVLQGQGTAAAVFLNTAPQPVPDSAPGAEPSGTWAVELAERFGITAPLVTCDLTARTLTALGRGSALSAGLGAAAARLSGLIEAAYVVEAVRQELQDLQVAADVIERNVQLAQAVFDELTPAVFESEERAAAAASTRAAAQAVAGAPTAGMHTVVYDDPVCGTASILSPGNSAQRNTGTWRLERPEIDRDVCTRCGLCLLACPDGAMSLDASGFPIIDYDHCKGCMICAQLCPLQAIGRTKEVRAW